MVALQVVRWEQGYLHGQEGLGLTNFQLLGSEEPVQSQCLVSLGSHCGMGTSRGWVIVLSSSCTCLEMRVLPCF